MKSIARDTNKKAVAVTRRENLETNLLVRERRDDTSEVSIVAHSEDTLVGNFVPRDKQQATR
jgi:hypothetical protein